MTGTGRSDWAAGAPKWAAVIVLGGASVAGLAWSVGREGQTWRGSKPGVAVVAAPTTPIAPVGASVGSSARVEPAAPAAGATADSAAKPEQPAPASIRRLININTASEAELELLPGIGPAKAKAIMDCRAKKGAFKRVEELDAVKGIGPKTIERLRALVTVE